MSSTSSTLIPELAHRSPENRWLTSFPEEVTPVWVAERFDDLMKLARDAGDDSARWIELVRDYNELVSHVSTLFSRIGLAFRQASDDEEAVAAYRRMNTGIAPIWSERGIELVRAIVASPAIDAIEAEFGTLFRRQLEIECTTSDPVIIPLQTELSEVLIDYTSTFGSATIQWRGKTLPISFARKAAHDTDRAERHAAHDSVQDFVERVAPQMQRLFDRSLELRSEMAHKLEMESYTRMRYAEMERFDWGPAEAASFRSAIQQHLVPLAHRLRTSQAAAQGVDLVHPADLEIWPEPPPAMTVDIDGQLDATVSVLRQLGTEFVEPFEMMMREGLIDLPARSGKGTGAFCTSFPDQRVPYIFCNSVGSPDDVKTLIHEFGHALQSWRSRDIELVQLRSPTKEACEIHSMTLEMLVLPYADQYFGDDAATFRREHVRSTLLVMPYMALVDEFQHAIYDAAGRHEPLDGTARCDLWEELTRRWRPGIDWDADPRMARNRWIQQLHIFNYPFYYLDYALARMVSWQLWLASIEDPARGLTTYLELCSRGGTESFRQLVLDAGLGDPFDPDVIADTVRRLEPHLELD